MILASLLALAGPAFAQAEPPTPKVIKAGGATPAATPAPAGEKIRWTDLEDGFAEAKRSGQPLLVDVSTQWCGWCKKMGRTTYTDPAVRAYVNKKFIASKVDAEDDARRVDYGGVESTHRQFADSFRINQYPTTLFFAPDGSLVTQVPGFVKPEVYIEVLRFIGDGHYRTTSWDAFQRQSTAARN
jgi:thioredoxin-related protein